MRLRTKRLLLTPLQAGDLDQLSFLGSPLKQPGLALSEMRESTARWLHALRAVERSEGGGWAIRRAVTRRIVGLCCYNAYDPPSQRVNISYGLEEQARGRGYAREALDAVLPAIFELGPIRAVNADIDPANERSIRLVQALGFSAEGMTVPGFNGHEARRYVLHREAFIRPALPWPEQSEGRARQDPQATSPPPELPTSPRPGTAQPRPWR